MSPVIFVLYCVLLHSTCESRAVCALWPLRCALVRLGVHSLCVDVSAWSCSEFFSFLFFKIYLFIDIRGGRKRGRETSICCCLTCTPTGDLAHNPGLCPDWESNWRTFGSQARAQSPESNQPGQNTPFFSFAFWGLSGRLPPRPLSFPMLPLFLLFEFCLFLPDSLARGLSLSSLLIF